MDLRHFSAAELRPLLQQEARRWEQRLHWEYESAVELLLEYLDGRVLPGYVAIDPATHRILGYTFCVYEAHKAVLGDVYAFGEAEAQDSPVCRTLLGHLLETLIASPGLERIESQLLMFAPGVLHAPLLRYGFRSFPRLFQMASLRPSVFEEAVATPEQLGALRLESWRPEYLHPAAELIHQAYAGHDDARINDQYRSVAGAERFLQNIIRFPGCGNFDGEHSLVLSDPLSGKPQALLLCSRVHQDTAHVTQLCVHPRLRGQGLGRMLLSTCAQSLKAHGLQQLSLTVTESNLTARRLYESLGFVTHQRFEALTWDARTTF